MDAEVLVAPIEKIAVRNDLFTSYVEITPEEIHFEGQGQIYRSRPQD